MPKKSKEEVGTPSEEKKPMAVVASPSSDVVPRFEISVDKNREMMAQIQQFVSEQLKEGEDYGVIPGVAKPSLLKPGAEKLCNIFGFGVEMIEVDKLEDWDRGFFNYTYKAVIRNKRTGLVESECIGSCNSKEAKYAYRWIPEFKASEPDKARADKHEVRKSKSGKDFVWFRLPNEDIYSQVNTLQKMAQKRAMVGAVLIATRASGFLTQDMEDITVTEVEYHEVGATDAGVPTGPSHQGPVKQPPGEKCSDCGKDTTQPVTAFSQKQYGRTLCFGCQSKLKKVVTHQNG